MQGMMQKVIGDVRHSRRIKTLPFKATVHVGPSETDIESMHLQDVRVARVDFTDCRTAREQSLSFLPRMLPNVIKTRVRGINVTLDFEFDTTIFGFEAQAGQARSTVVGEMNLTLALLTYDDWHVSDCSGEFAIQETHLLGDYGDTGVPVPNGLPMAELMCYGPGGALGALGSLVGLELQPGGGAGGGGAGGGARRCRRRRRGQGRRRRGRRRSGGLHRLGADDQQEASRGCARLARDGAERAHRLPRDGQLARGAGTVLGPLSLLLRRAAAASGAPAAAPAAPAAVRWLPLPGRLP